jgi:hypothetical protein
MIASDTDTFRPALEPDRKWTELHGILTEVLIRLVKFND